MPLDEFDSPPEDNQPQRNDDNLVLARPNTKHEPRQPQKQRRRPPCSTSFHKYFVFVYVI